jgi:hypothetical protein
MSDLEQVGSLVERLLRRLGLPAQGDTARLVEDWAELAGEPWGSRSRPVGLKDGELLLEVPDGATATLLKYRERDLVHRLESRLGAAAITSVRIRVERGKKGP